jgi:hypothetical protein
LPSYSFIGASHDSWKVNTPSIRRERHEEREAPPLHRIKEGVLDGRRL